MKSMITEGIRKHIFQRNDSPARSSGMPYQYCPAAFSERPPTLGVSASGFKAMSAAGLSGLQAAGFRSQVLSRA